MNDQGRFTVDTLAAAGLGLVVAGVGWMHPPAAAVVAGLGFMAAAWIVARAAAPPVQPKRPIVSRVATPPDRTLEDDE